MNVVMVSPHFPPNFYHFCAALRRAGANVLGIADAPYEELRPELQDALTEYYRVPDALDYDQLLRGVAYLTFRHGKMDWLESHNEFWLETDARLRTDFNIPGIKNDLITDIKAKSRMKARFIAAGVPVARGRVVHTPDEARRFIAETGYPVVAKPDIGVGAAHTYRINDDAELARFFEAKPPIDYIMEEFISGVIYSFDGLADREGNPVFLHRPCLFAGHHGDGERGPGSLLPLVARDPGRSGGCRPPDIGRVRRARRGSSTSSSSARIHATAGSSRSKSTCGRRAARPWTCSTTPTRPICTRNGPT